MKQNMFSITAKQKKRKKYGKYFISLIIVRPGGKLQRSTSLRWIWLFIKYA
jgi:hypothetical protein